VRFITLRQWYRPGRTATAGAALSFGRRSTVHRTHAHGNRSVAAPVARSFGRHNFPWYGSRSCPFGRSVARTVTGPLHSPDACSISRGSR
jgi:hypothetical protein